MKPSCGEWRGGRRVTKKLGRRERENNRRVQL
jgi:hypothetical protein